MAHVRVFRHYFHTPLLLLSTIEAICLFGVAYLAYLTAYQELPGAARPFFASALMFSLCIVASMVAMGVYEARIRDGWLGMLLRTIAGIFLLGGMLIGLFSYVFPSLAMGRSALFFGLLEAFVVVTVVRWLFNAFIGDSVMKQNIVVYGTGTRARKIATRMRRASDQRAFVLMGFVHAAGDEDLVSEHGATLIELEQPLADYCRSNDIDEIVTALDDRREREEAGLPINELLECRLMGVNVIDIQAFIEREAGKIDVELLRPSWLVFADGFATGIVRDGVKRTFDLLVAITMLALTWPIMIIACLLMWLENRCSGPVLAIQNRVGLDGSEFRLTKIRSMNVDAEEDGQPQWTEPDDPRITTVGRWLRKTRIDELPQLISVIRGDMSFVGPRPERPEFVRQLREKIPFYDQRHRVKPGITGWAQVCYPYGASVVDAREKLNYDMYYLKNQGLLLDLIILLQTVEIILIGDGAR